MRLTGILLLLASVLMITAVAFSADPDVVELAKKEKARRAQTGGTHKVFTNKDIEALKAKDKQSSGKGRVSAPAVQDQSQTQAASDQDSLGDAGFDYDKEKEFWRGRYEEVKTRITKAQNEVKRLQPIVDQLKLTFVQSKDPTVVAHFEEEVQVKTTELEDAKKELQAAQQSMEDLEEEGRKAGALPGWFRDE